MIRREGIKRIKEIDNKNPNAAKRNQAKWHKDHCNGINDDLNCIKGDCPATQFKDASRAQIQQSSCGREARSSDPFSGFSTKLNPPFGTERRREPLHRVRFRAIKVAFTGLAPQVCNWYRLHAYRCNLRQLPGICAVIRLIN
jgi:hypothetical protein